MMEHNVDECSISQGNNRNGTSIHLTLPISCQICLGKVKDPAICSNNHVFCTFCLEQWLKNSTYCPACRVVINETNPYRKILGSLDDSTQEQINDPTTKAQLRRTRLKMLFEEFQNEIEYLEEKVEKLSSENMRLKDVNDDIRQQLEDSEVRYMKMIHNPVVRNKSNSDKNTVADITTILKLSNKLQEMINANENITQVNSALRKDLKTLRNEREVYVKDIKKLKEENKFPRSPQKYNKYAMVALQTKVDNYEREIQQWKKALKRADDYIEELNTEVEKYKSATGDIEEKDAKENQKFDNYNTPVLSTAESVITKTKETFSSLTASETLQNLLSSSSKNKSPSIQWTRSGKANDGLTLKESVEMQTITRKTSIDSNVSNQSRSHDSPMRSEASPELLSDPSRFPACAKLIELTKARYNHVPSSARDTQFLTIHNLYPSDEPSVSSYSNSVISSAGNIRTAVSSSPNTVHSFSKINNSLNNSTRLHQKRCNGNDERPFKDSVEGDDITVVLPSADQNPWIHDAYSGRSSKIDPISTNPHYLPPSQIDSFMVESVNTNDIIVVKPQNDYGCYPLNSFVDGHSDAKKIKIENTYE